MNRLAILCAVLAALNVSSAVAVIYTKHLSRQSYAEISAYQHQIDALAVQWSQLQIEEGTFSEYGRVERAAREQLGMSLPRVDDTVMIVR